MFYFLNSFQIGLVFLDYFKLMFPLSWGTIWSSFTRKGLNCMWQTHCHIPTQMRNLAQRVISSLTYCRSPQSHQNVWLNSKGTLSLILLCKKWHISLLMGGQKAQECTPRSKSKRLEGLGSTCPYAKSMSSNYTRDTLELTLQRKERGKLCIGPPWRLTLTLR